MAPDLLESEKSIFSSRGGINEAKLFLSNILLRTQDTIQSVAQAAKLSIVKIHKRKFEYFDNVYRRLTLE